MRIGKRYEKEERSPLLPQNASLSPRARLLTCSDLSQSTTEASASECLAHAPKKERIFFLRKFIKAGVATAWSHYRLKQRREIQQRAALIYEIPVSNPDSYALRAFQAWARKDRADFNYCIKYSLSDNPADGQAWAKKFLDIGEPRYAAAIYFNMAHHQNKVPEPIRTPDWKCYLDAACCNTLRSPASDVDWNCIQLFQYPTRLRRAFGRAKNEPWFMAYMRLSSILSESCEDGFFLLKSLILLDYEATFRLLASNQLIINKIRFFSCPEFEKKGDVVEMARDCERYLRKIKKDRNLFMRFSPHLYL